MITYIIGYKKQVSFSSGSEDIVSFEPTESEWRVLQAWLQHVIIGYAGEQPSWRCVPLFSNPGGFMAQKLFTR